MRAAFAILFLTFVSGCVSTPAPQPQGAAPDGSASANFGEIATRVERVAEQECRARLSRVNCDFAIVIERDPRAGINAFQTLDRNGRPLIIVTEGLIGAVANTDELAFVIGHEAAHHIRQHIPQQVSAARRGALVFGVLAQMGGADAAGVREASEIGATVGARRFSQDHELEADRLGTIIAAGAGFDPVRGSLFFSRLPDPGNRVLGTHPPNAARQQVVRETAAQL